MKFSQRETRDLLKAWGAISLAFAILLKGLGLLPALVVSAFTVGIGFLLHELAHKFTAQHYRCWAEFRADNRMLVFAVLSAFLGFIFAAPGAVFISGHVTRKQNGIIAAAGPVTNIVLAAGFWLLIPVLGGIAMYGAMINSFLALFNMIPIWQLDGAKVWRWNRSIFFVLIGLAFIGYMLVIA